MLIGLLGRKRCGKDTVASFLNQEYGFQRLAFADPMKAIIRAIDPYVNEFGARLSDIDLEEDALKKAYPEYRRLLQRLGTEAVRENISQTFWIDLLLRKAADYDNVVVSDVRFPDEAQAIRNAKGQIWKIERPGTFFEDSHASEAQVDLISYDRLIINDGTLSDLLLKTHATFRADW